MYLLREVGKIEYDLVRRYSYYILKFFKKQTTVIVSDGVFSLREGYEDTPKNLNRLYQHMYLKPRLEYPDWVDGFFWRRFVKEFIQRGCIVQVDYDSSSGWNLTIGLHNSIDDEKSTQLFFSLVYNQDSSFLWEVLVGENLYPWTEAKRRLLGVIDIYQKEPKVLEDIDWWVYEQYS